jgi:tRNA wybutosine-synthesizing protein 1
VDTMDVLHGKDETRTVLRTTLVGGENMANPDWYAGFFRRADPDFVELKAYMHVGDSRDRLDREAMPDHEDVLAFTREVQSHLPEHTVLRDQEVSRVALLAKDEDTWVPKLRADSEFWDGQQFAAD